MDFSMGKRHAPANRKRTHLELIAAPRSPAADSGGSEPKWPRWKAWGVAVGSSLMLWVIIIAIIVIVFL